MKPWLPRVGRILWVGACVSVLALALNVYDGTPTTSDAEILLIYGMLVLSFPTGILAGHVLGGIVELYNLASRSYLQTS